MSGLPPEKKIQCNEIFQYYDKDRDGRLSKEDFNDAMKTLGIFIPKEEMEIILSTIPVCDYEHFEEIASKKLSQKVNKDEIVNSFLFIDPSGSGKCKKEDLVRAFTVLGEPLKASEVNELIKEFVDKDENVDYKKLIVALVGK